MSIEEKHDEDFTIFPNILDENLSSKKRKDLYRLPEWMSSLAKRFDSRQLQTETTISINQIDYLDEDIRSILINNLSIQYLFPVQSQVIPYLIQQNQSHSPIPLADICVSSPTGSGKTLTYVIPLLQCIRHRVIRAIRIIILLPVQDLAEQVYHVVNQIGNKLQLKTALLAGQQSFEDEQKILVKQQLNGSWTSSIDVIVCTPGRLVEHISRTSGFSLIHLRYLVIDEADRIIDEFKQDWLNILDKAVGLLSHLKNDFQPYMLSQSSSNRKIYQKLLFSATLTHNPEILQQLNLFRPVLFSSSTSIIMPSTLRENFIICSITYKPLIIAYLIQNQLHSERIMIFVHSKKDVDRLSSLLKLLLPDNIKVSHISRKLPSKKIQTRLNMFEHGQIQILVCSDVLARGIDIPNIDCVILYDLPKNIRTYTHRIGRTARAGKLGRSITMVEKERLIMFRTTIKTYRRNKLKPMNIRKENFSFMLNDYQKALEIFSSQEQKKKLKQKK
ncbi:unnamed protein product [Rotaria sordida]|uniref:ATP-dependent RNA helicase n=1 Tax=Rotaria sordida TaxID=392033 RepID=A0A815MMM1_9BILA|nr:unnamed protein product [Rotaria sordida]